MAFPTDQQISARAYELWEEAGRPEGRDLDFWHQAERELRQGEEGSDGIEEPTLKVPPG